LQVTCKHACRYEKYSKEQAPGERKGKDVFDDAYATVLESITELTLVRFCAWRQAALRWHRPSHMQNAVQKAEANSGEKSRALKATTNAELR